MECFRIDESGYTGFDLLNPEQHFQGATAVAISDEDAARLIKDHFPKLQASELKYRSLSRRPGNHPRLLMPQRAALALRVEKAPCGSQKQAGCLASVCRDASC